MFRIGDFSRLSGVSVRMLRHYDEIGLLPPAFVDGDSGYRYYAVDQFEVVRRVRALQESGFRLEEIGGLLRERPAAEDVYRLLARKRAEAAREVEAARARLGRIDARLAELASGAPEAAPEVVFRSVPAVPVLRTRAVVPAYTDSLPMVECLLAYLRSCGAAVDSGWVFVYHDAEAREDGVDVEVAVPLARPLRTASPLPPGVERAELPPVEAAATIHTGAMSDVSRAYVALARWMERCGYRPSGPSRNVALRRDPSDPEASVTEVLIPVARVPAEGQPPRQGP